MHVDLGLGVPHGYFLAQYYAPIPGVLAGAPEKFLQLLTTAKIARKKAAPAREPHPIELLPYPLGVDSALADGERHAVDRQHVGRDAVVDMMGLGIAHHGLERLDHDVLQLLVDH